MTDGCNGEWNINKTAGRLNEMLNCIIEIHSYGMTYE